MSEKYLHIFSLLEQTILLLNDTTRERVRGRNNVHFIHTYNLVKKNLVIEKKIIIFYELVCDTKESFLHTYLISLVSNHSTDYLFER